MKQLCKLSPTHSLLNSEVRNTDVHSISVAVNAIPIDKGVSVENFCRFYIMLHAAWSLALIKTRIEMKIRQLIFKIHAK